MVGSLINKMKNFYKVLNRKDTNIASMLSEIATNPAETGFKALPRVKVAEM